MPRLITKIYHRILVFLHLSPLSLAQKCRITFGAAVILVLCLALTLPYIWMKQLTKKAYLDAARAKSDLLLENHFQLKTPDQPALPLLSTTGSPADPKNLQMQWISFTKDSTPAGLTNQQKDMLTQLKNNPHVEDSLILTKREGILQGDYVRIFRAKHTCISCHNPQGCASPFSENQPVGAVVIQGLATDVEKLQLMNWFWIMMAGLIAGVGAIVAFYMITQRVILRPIRQLRALANNVAEGNLDVRSAIKTRDEYEKLANAFNHMLDT